jgi:hypothetical protein
MSPAQREEVAKRMMSSPISINNDAPESSSSDDDNQNNAEQAREVRNKYLKRIGVGDAQSDCEPLLH